MASPQTASAESALLARIAESRRRTDSLFQLLPPSSMYDRPIPERHRMIFYLGHLEAFDWNLLAPALGLKSDEPEFNKLFAFGIDPVDGGLPTDEPGDWPKIARVEQYNKKIRAALDEKLRTARAEHSQDPLIADGTLINVAIEHRLMHAETLAYLLHNMPVERKIPHAIAFPEARPEPKQGRLEIPSGTATLGQARESGNFGWDNEFGEQQVSVPAFAIDTYPVTNGEYMKFVHAAGYENAKYWRPEDWEWRTQKQLEHPRFWLQCSGGPATDPNTQWEYRTMFGPIPLPRSWPVFVSHAEAAAFANWAGKKLPTEAEWHRAAYGTPEGRERAYPWGDEYPNSNRGNLHHERWDLTPVDAHPAGKSAWGVCDLVGNGWEWTSTSFAPLPGFEPFSFYPGYSANFFDGKHFVMKG